MKTVLLFLISLLTVGIVSRESSSEHSSSMDDFERFACPGITYEVYCSFSESISSVSLFLQKEGTSIKGEISEFIEGLQTSSKSEPRFDDKGFRAAVDRL